MTIAAPATWPFERAASRGEPHRHHGGDAELLGLVELTGNVALCDVRDFVRQDAGQLRLALRRKDQAAMHADEAARHRKGVDARVVDPGRNRNPCRDRC